MKFFTLATLVSVALAMPTEKTLAARDYIANAVICGSRGMAPCGSGTTCRQWAGLTCSGGVADCGGYCFFDKTCSADQDCGDNALCLQTTAEGGGPMSSCIAKTPV